VCWITLNRPEAGNAITPDMRDRMVTWLEEASDDLAVRAVVLIGTGEKGFCTGADLRTMPAVPDRPAGAPARAVGDAARQIRTGWQRLISALLDCEKPVIAAVNATAAGGGMHLALACDLVLAAEEAKFIEVFVRRGIAPDAGGAYLLPRLIGPQRAKELFFFGDDLPAREAERLGLVNRVVPREQLPTVAAEWAARLAAGPTKAIGATKYLTNRSLESDRATALWDEAVAQELVIGSEDCREGLAAFAERRTPSFKGW
jgi:2-(1,2-epoxy-1,2-dihydrophenyl)acetyl-CoA isomerase